MMMKSEDSTEIGIGGESKLVECHFVAICQ